MIIEFKEIFFLKERTNHQRTHKILIFKEKKLNAYIHFFFIHCNADVQKGICQREITRALTAFILKLQSRTINVIKKIVLSAQGSCFSGSF